jgi:phosphatidylserine decarboxylase
VNDVFRSEPFFRAYPYLPHGLINRTAKKLAEARWPRPIVDAAVRTWVRRAGIDMSDFEERPYQTVEDFFLRKLRAGARPLAPGFVSPVDGLCVGAGRIERDRPLVVKGQRISLARLVNGTIHDLPLAAYEGGLFATLFLSPAGYHRIHVPEDVEVLDCRWIPGRHFPQNEDALRHIHGIYERNERAVLRARRATGEELLMVLVGASLVGGIHLEGFERRDWIRPSAFPIRRRFARGEEIGHFSFGSTVVVLLPRTLGGQIRPAVGASMRMGELLWEATHDRA